MKRLLIIPWLLVACVPEDDGREPPLELPPASATASSAPTASAPPAKAGERPVGWILAGTAADHYEAAVDLDAHQGRSSGRLSSREGSDPKGFGTLMQSFAADDYRTSRVRLRAWLKTEGVTGWAGLWLRIDVGGEGAVLDNMQDRPLSGDTPWRAVEVVLDVPKQADLIALGVLLDGPGMVWIDDVTIEKVDHAVPLTIPNAVVERPEAPVNLTFVENAE